MNAREAKRLREADDTPYAVLVTDGGLALIPVTGCRSARVVQGGKAERIILTASEAALLHTDRAAFLRLVGR